jgi:hypothetical protein
MTSVQRKDDAEDRYAEASKRLRTIIRDDEVYEVANAWAREQCTLAEQFDWPSSQPRLKQRLEAGTLEAGKSATKLADYLDSKWLLHTERRMEAAEQESGVKLGLDAASLAKYLWAFADQCREDNVRCGPLMMKFTDKNQSKMPPPAVALAIALWNGFGQVPDFVEANRGTHREFLPWLMGPITGGAYLRAAVLFANAALKSLKVGTTNEDAVKQWRRNNKGRLRYWGFR